jgi:hypothetical protein
MPTTNDAPAGTQAPEQWTPYKIWVGDLWQCRGCNAQILSGFGQQPISEHYFPTFSDTLVRTSADQLQVNDC